MNNSQGNCPKESNENLNKPSYGTKATINQNIPPMPSRNQNINQTTQINHPIKRQHSSQLQKVHPNNESFQTNQSKNTHGNQNKSSKSNRNLYRTTKKRGTAAKVGRGIVSRMFYTIALVKKRLLEMELEGEIEASVGALGIVYCAEVEVHKAEDIHEQDLFLLEIEQNGNFGDEEEKDREKDKEKTGPGFIKKTVNKFLGGFKDQLVLLAEKMDTHHLEGKVGIGLYLKLPLMCKIKLEPLISTHVLHEWYLKELELENKRFLGTLTVRVIGAKGINKKSACALSLKVGDVKWKTSFKGGNSDTFLWDETLQPFPCSPRGDEITLKIFQKALLGEELYDELFLKVDKFGLIPSQNKTVSIPFESGSLTFDFYQQFTKSNVHGILKVDIIEGKDLPKKDITGKSDPYVVLAQGKVTETSVTKILNNPKLSTVKSTWKNQTLFPVWNELLNLSIFDEKAGFTILCFDYDFGGEDDHMGSFFISLDGVSQRNQYDKWIPMEKGSIHIKFELILFDQN